MTSALAPPDKKNPQKRTRIQALPSEPRSRAALGLTSAAAEGRFRLQRCAECGAVQYPPRDACTHCLSTDLHWRDIDPNGHLVAETTVRTSTSTYFRERAPWRIGIVRLDAGVSVMAHLHGDISRGGPARVDCRLDKAGQGVLVAMPVERSANMEDDLQLREMTSDPKYRRVLITDARAANAAALAQAFSEAGAALIFLGEAESWRGNPNRAALEAIKGATIVPLDVTDTSSVTTLSGEIGGKVDILVNNSSFLRPDRLLARGNTTFARDEMEVNYLGLMRLALAFGPAMRGRGADGINSASAWVNLLSVYAYSPLGELASFSASQSAALSLAKSLRPEMRSGGVRVMNVFTGPTDDEWHQIFPAPKVSAQAIASSVISGLRGGLEDVFVGDVAQDLIERWRVDPKILEREMAGRDGGRA